MNVRQAKKVRRSYHDCCGGYLTRGLRHWYRPQTVEEANRVFFRSSRAIPSASPEGVQRGDNAGMDSSRTVAGHTGGDVR